MTKTKSDWRDTARLDPRVETAYRDPDGCWIELHYGWTAEPKGAHGIHERQGRSALVKLRGVVPCSCDECVFGLAKKARQ
jgi:hypothetical protein